MKYYPFLNSERNRLKELDLRLEQLSQNSIYAAALDNAGKDIIGKAQEPTDEDFAVIEFTLAKILLSIIDNNDADESYSERKSDDWRNALEKESLTYLIKIAREDFGMDIQTGDSLRIDFIDFLRMKPEFLRLSQMNLLKGYVQVTKSQLTWILKGAIKKSILESIPRGKKFPEDFTKVANSLKGKVAEKKKFVEDRPRITSINEEALPPCVEGIIKGLESGRANHNAHFVLVTFMHGLNLDDKAILDVFRRSPKFKERITAYQIKFSKDRGYTCPGCESIKGYGLCPTTCPRKHPVSNYFLNLRELRYKKPEKKVEIKKDD